MPGWLSQIERPAASVSAIIPEEWPNLQRARPWIGPLSAIACRARRCKMVSFTALSLPRSRGGGEHGVDRESGAKGGAHVLNGNKYVGI